MSFSFEPHTGDWSLSMNPAVQRGRDTQIKDLNHALLSYQFQREPVNNNVQDPWCILDTPFDPFGGSDGNLFHLELMAKVAQDHAAQHEIYQKEVRRAREMDKHWEKYLSPMAGFPYIDPIPPPQTLAGNSYGDFHYI